MKVFKSKVDVALPVVFMITSIPPIIMGIKNGDWMFFVILFVTFALVFYLLYDTNYTVNKDILKIHSGFIVNKNILISEIKSIRKTDSILSAPAASLTDRIEISYGNSKSMIISPKEKNEFIDELLKINPTIEIKN